ncbi:hypothetical protein JCM11641_003065 [Rhodosporidiobolus odoratus]
MVAHTHSFSLALLSLLSLAASTVSANAVVGAVNDLFSSHLSSRLFDNDSAELLAFEEDLLPPPEQADYQLVTEEERDTIFDRSVDGAEAAKTWKKRGLSHHALASALHDRSTIACASTAECTAAGSAYVANSHRFCASGKCSWRCNSGFESTGSACVQPDVGCSSTADCTKAGSSFPANSHRYCDNKVCSYRCNSGFESKGTDCVKPDAPSGDVACSSTADCTTAGSSFPDNSHRYCSNKVCTFSQSKNFSGSKSMIPTVESPGRTECNSNWVLSGSSCVQAGSTTTTDPPQSIATAVSGISKAWTGKTSFVRAGETGVGAMQATLVDDDHIVIYDKAENNALKDKSGAPAWGSIYSISRKTVRALNLETNSFCAGGGWISNGTLVSVGGNPQQTYINDKAKDGLAGVRLFTPCTNDKCDVYENPSRIRMTSARWYPSTVRLTDGSILIAGGMIAGGYNNQESTDNPTMEFYPPKGDGLQFYSSFLHDALNSNLFPVMYTLPSGYVFIAANQIAMLFDWETNTERRLKNFPSGVTITYPGSAAAALLPLTIENNWTPEVVFFGGTTLDLDADPSKVSANEAASKQVSRMVLDAAGIRGGWKTESMPMARVMGDAVVMPDGNVLIVNGAGSGIAGYGNVKDEVGASNARNPVKEPILYNPNAASGKRFTRGLGSAAYERLYHSSATLLPDGSVWIAGSNPNDGVSTVTYATRYEVEIFNPPYMTQSRPSYSGIPAKLLYGKSYTLTVSVPSGTQKVQAVVIDIGYSTHGVHMSNRYVELETSLSGKKLTIKGPKNTGIYPPGPGWLYILADGVPSKGLKTMVGPGNSPPVSTSAIKNMLAKTKG